MIAIVRKLNRVAVLLALPVLLALGGTAAAADLPDFTKLVDQHAPAVVNISTVRHSNPARRFGGRGAPNDEMEEFLRRFFPPDRFPQPDRNAQSLGSGFIISRDGYILTNYHVVASADEVKVRLSDRRELDAEVVGSDRRSDLALLKIDASGLPTVKLGKSADLSVGEWVLAIGSPFGFDYSVTAGIVSAKGRSLPTAQDENYVPFIQTDVAINPGNSGGPLFNLDGEVVGINSQIYSNSGGFMGVSFAIPIDVAMEVVEQLRENGRVSRGWLGVLIQEVDRDLAESFGLDRPGGALISRVLDDSPAARGGLREGDIITRFNGLDIDRSGELPHHVGRTPANSKAKLRIVREGKTQDIELTIGELPTGDDGEVAAADDDSLGLAVEPIAEAIRDRLGISGGVRVTSAAGAAAEAGIQRGDIILRLNNAVINSVEDFDRVVDKLPAGRSVPVLVRRNDAPVFLALRVPE